ncbi:hypothetical protein AUC44_09390 [Deinococcus actinosclerus]|uniref:Uncharacterized protein n=1 Tax=Deinococcus actinosclerus TaxID=1768108 RepID=A0ABN4K5A7_9DEIO|nr:hypothetical protein AUC44_09390 [Deinococcus actinosclerus]
MGGLVLPLSALGALRWRLRRRVLLITGTVTLLVALLLARGLPWAPPAALASPDGGASLTCAASPGPCGV